MSWLIDLTKIYKCMDHRHEQLKKEKIIDEKLKNCSCHNVTEYLLAYREMNRRMEDDMYKTSMYDKPSVLVKQLEKIEEHFMNMETSKNICKELPNITNDIKNN